MDEGFTSAGERIRRIRRLRHLTQEKLAELAGLHPSYVGQVERGQRTPSVRTLNAVSRVLGVDPAFLLRASEDPASPVEDLMALVAVATPEQVQLITRIAETVVSSSYQVERDLHARAGDEAPDLPIEPSTRS